MTIKEIHQNPAFRIIQFNVGQGDHCLIQFSDGAYGIVDFYFESEDSKLTEPPAITYFRHLDEEAEIIIKFVCISHLDSDHIKGFEDALDILINDFEAQIGSIWVPAYVDFRDVFHEKLTDSAILKNFIERYFGPITLNYVLSDRFQRIAFLHSESKYADLVEFIGVGIGDIDLQDRTVQFIAPKIKDIITTQEKTIDSVFESFINLLEKIESTNDANSLNRKLYKDKTARNDMSVIFNLNGEFGNSVFTGDANLDLMMEVSEKVANIDFMKGAHHGSKNSSSLELWTNIFSSSSKINIGFSAGRKKGNTDHPDSETIKQIFSAARPEDQFSVLSTNLCQECLEKGTRFNIESNNLDLFDFDESDDAHADFQEVEERPIEGGTGLLGLLFEFSETEAKNPTMLVSSGMKQYHKTHEPACPFGEYSISIEKES